MEDGKMKCGVCKTECNRLIVHMNWNEYCTEYFSNMVEFKRKYSEFRDKMSRRRNAEKRKAKAQDHDDCKRKESCVDKGTAIHIQNTVSYSSSTAESFRTGPHTAAESKQERVFSFGGFDFKELGDGKIKCGVC